MILFENSSQRHYFPVAVRETPLTHPTLRIPCSIVETIELVELPGPNRPGIHVAAAQGEQFGIAELFDLRAG